MDGESFKRTIFKIKMPHFQIKMLEGKTEEQKEKLTEEVIKAAQKILGFGDESYSVSIQDYSMNEWKEKVYPGEIMGNQKILYKKPGYKM